MPMKSKRNLTRFTYETTAFQGWRLCISRTGKTFTKYFSDKKYGGPKKSLQAAEKAGVAQPSRQVMAELMEESTQGNTLFYRFFTNAFHLDLSGASGWVTVELLRKEETGRRHNYLELNRAPAREEAA